MNQTLIIIKKVLKNGFYFLLWFWMLVNLGWSLTIGCADPMIIMPEEVVPWMTSMFIVTMIYLLMVPSQKWNWALLPIIGLWSIQYIYALIFHYHPYDTLMDGIGFFATLTCYLHNYLNSKKQSINQTNKMA